MVVHFNQTEGASRDELLGFTSAILEEVAQNVAGLVVSIFTKLMVMFLPVASRRSSSTARKELFEMAHSASQNCAVNKPKEANVSANPQGSKTIIKESSAFSSAQLVQEMSLNAVNSLNQGICSVVNGGRSVFNKWQNSAFV